ncbi:DUF1329 domain-containing protein [Pseudomonas sp. UL073]|uniref:DUF1329 domain-containing protein n=1 Tax=Zestomonas insulae TaxID=2809017 RepID=A0ABS2IHJ0_9GAMM|nr:DUF1329 domain-containing protein [Pseudomonas insulae]MBM7062536.1 DUF1329 domain-containing protein [Pseudomonas insulae]
MNSSRFLPCSFLALSLLASSVMAAVSQQEADQLGTKLTPLGAEKEGSADGKIPAYDGGLPTNAAPISNGFLSDPFASDQPEFTITAQNAEQYKDKLTPGQLAMFKRYASTYKMPVFKTRRTANAPDAIYAIAKRSAVQTQSIDGGNGLSNFADTHYYAFPIPKNGVEVVWNHITRYRGGNAKRLLAQASPQTNGSFTAVKFEDQVAYPDSMPDLSKDQGSNLLLLFRQEVTAPARLAGNVTLVHETLDQVKEPRMAWVYNAGQRRVRRAPQVAYDGPGTASDGLRTSDNFDMYNGAPDRYDWKLVGKQELYIPYNSYRLESNKLKYSDILKAGHINQDLARYELHRVWHVVATLKAGERHIYAKRDLFFDEDSWQAAEADHYDGRGQLWRVGEGHAIQHYGQQASIYAVETLYDLTAGRYVANGMRNEEKRGIEYGGTASFADFTPAALRQSGVR